MSDIRQHDRYCIEILLEHGACTARELMIRHPIDQFQEDTAAAWTAVALTRGVVEITGGTGRSMRVNLTDKGRGWDR